MGLQLFLRFAPARYAAGYADLDTLSAAGALNTEEPVN
jgi:hypothetical protein